MTFDLAMMYVSLLWVISFGPYNFSVIIRSVVHDRRYAFSRLDIMTGVSIFAILVNGFPPLGILK